MPELAVGMHVKYVPHVGHHLDADHRGAALFHFHFVNKGPRHAAGDRVRLEEHGQLTRAPDGKLLTGTNHEIVHGEAVRPWDAWIVGINADGTADLDVIHPCGQPVPGERKGMMTHHKPDRSAFPNAPGIKHDPTGKLPDTFHLTGEA